MTSAKTEQAKSDLTKAYAQALRKAVDYNNQICDPNTLPREALRWRDTTFEAIRFLEFLGAIEPGVIKVYAGSFAKANNERTMNADTVRNSR